ncbi:MAG TPA: hypothetical protein VMF89_32445, partial [Polyangiales bacterium]|nr:hypothetical protein [Polyangiales bacterium]
MSAVNDVPATPALANEQFVDRHVGSDASEIAEMLRVLGFDSLEAMVRKTVPEAIRLARPLDLPAALTERAAGLRLRELSEKNHVFRSYIGMGYSNCVTPAVISRNILENPGWYTQYTPYQAEIAQGRLEALLNFQTMVADLTGLPLANASLLDEGTAAAEAMHMAHALCTSDARGFFVSADCHPQTIAVLQGRAKGLGIE